MRASLWLHRRTTAPGLVSGAETSISRWDLTDDQTPFGGSRINLAMSIMRQFRGEINIKAVGATALVAVGCLSLPALAQENGTIDRDQVPGTAAVAPAVPVTPGGPWNETT